MSLDPMEGNTNSTFRGPTVARPVPWSYGKMLVGTSTGRGIRKNRGPHFTVGNRHYDY
jgi:hypothetical protein